MDYGAHAARHDEPELDPVGTWSCVVYGHPDFGDERVLMHFAAGGVVSSARQATEGETPSWTALSAWTAVDGKFAFRDARSGRQFEADLRRPTLGGSWRTPSLVGGWWCSSVDPLTLPAIEPPAAAPVMPPLIPIVTATPWYPLLAIRAAKQGHAVTCFLVGADGLVVKPDVVELSDEIFREPILTALERSRYQGWDDARVFRPGCRSYVFKLDALNEPDVE